MKVLPSAQTNIHSHQPSAQHSTLLTCRQMADWIRAVWAEGDAVFISIIRIGLCRHEVTPPDGFTGGTPLQLVAVVEVSAIVVD